MQLERENIREWLQRAGQWLLKPTATDWDEARQEYTARVILVLLCVLALGGTFVSTLAWLAGSEAAMPLVGALMAGGFAAGWALTARVNRRLGNYIPPALVFLMAVYDTYLEGPGAPALLFYAVAILLASILLGKFAQWALLALSVLTYIGLGAAHAQGQLPPVPAPEAAFYSWSVGVPLGLTALTLLLWLSNTQYQIALKRAEIYAAEAEQLHGEMRRLAQATARLNWMGEKLTASLSMSQIGEQLSHIATRIIDAEGVSVWLRAEAANDSTLVCWASSGVPEAEAMVGTILPPGQGIAGWVFERGRVVATADPAQDARFFAGIDAQIGHQTRSLLAVPLRVRQQTIGVLELVNKRGSEFSPSDVNLVEALAASVAVAIDNIRLMGQMRQYASDLETQNAELDAFAHTVAHDLKTPMAVITGYGSMLKHSWPQLPEEMVRHHLERISVNVQRMTNIIDELLLLASVRKVEQLKLGPVDMAAVVAQVEERLEDMIVSHETELTLPESWPTALGYAPWIEEVWVNYLSNAIKYGGQPPCVTLGATPVTARDGRAQVRFWVRDNGEGLSRSQRARLFAPFERLAQTRAEGHGLGLSIVRRIVEKLGGEVGVESEVGVGSTFYFTLPAVEAVPLPCDIQPAGESQG